MLVLVLQTRIIDLDGGQIGAKLVDLIDQRRDNLQNTTRIQPKYHTEHTLISSAYFFPTPPLPRVPFCLAFLFPPPSSTPSYTAPTDDDIPDPRPEIIANTWCIQLTALPRQL
jgi:hypothetical protein